MTTMREELNKLLRTMECYDYDADEYKGRHAVHSFAAMLATVLIKNDAHLAKGAQEWQPIETAPKDGTTVLLACGDRVTAGDWVSPEMHPTWEGDDFDAHWQSWDGGFHNDGEHAATHWMPLPAAPMLSQRGEAEGG